MPRRYDLDHSWDDDREPAEDPVDSDDHDEDASIPCLNCEREIHEDSERCPYCGTYISREESPPARKPWWIIVGVIACLYVVYRSIIWW